MSDTTDLNLGREAVVAMAAKVVLLATGFLGFVLFARVLGPTGVGIYYFVLAGAKLAVQVVGGVANAVKKRVSEVDTGTAAFLGCGLLIYVAYVGSLLVLAFLLEPLLVAHVGPFRYALGGVAILASLGLFNLLNRTYAGVGKPGASFWLDTVRSVLTLVAQVTFLRLGYGAFGLMGGFVLATMATNVLVFVLVGVRPRLPDRETVERVVSFARWSVPSSLLGSFYSRADPLLIGLLVGSGAVGLYESALRITLPATFVAISISDSLTVKASGLHSVGEDVEDDLRNAMSYAALVSIPLFAGALALPPGTLLTYLLQAEFAAAWPAVLGLALFQVFNSIRMPFDAVINGLDRPDIQLRLRLFTVLVHLPLAVGAAHAFGLLGVVAATVVAESVRVVAYQFVAYRLFGNVVVTRPMGEQVLSAAAMGLAVAGLSGLLAPVNSLAELAALIGAGVVVYFGLLVAVSAHFRATVRSVLADTAPGLGPATGR